MATLALRIHHYPGKVQVNIIIHLIDGLYVPRPLGEIKSEKHIFTLIDYYLKENGSSRVNLLKREKHHDELSIQSHLCCVSMVHYTTKPQLVSTLYTKNLNRIANKLLKNYYPCGLPILQCSGVHTHFQKITLQ